MMVISNEYQILDDSKRDSQTLLTARVTYDSEDVTVDGHSLDIATVVSVARYSSTFGYFRIRLNVLQSWKTCRG